MSLNALLPDNCQHNTPVLFLLHGMSDDHTAWLRRTSLERYIENRNIAVIMPAAHHSFYTDMKLGGQYFTFISEEVPRLCACCGTEDFLYDGNVAFRRKCKDLNLQLRYEEGPGLHDWCYWDIQIQCVLDWLQNSQ